MSDLQELLVKIEAATGPSQGIDTELMLAFRGRDASDPFFDRYSPYTASIDAALALVERVLPAPTFSLDRVTAETPPKPKVIFPIWTCEFHWFINPAWHVRADRPTAPLAILAALLKALIAQQVPHD